MFSRSISKSSIRFASRSRAFSAVTARAAVTKTASITNKNKPLSTVLTLAAGATVFAVAAAPPVTTNCHCQVPCGIFNDPLRVELIKEHAATIKKSMLEISRLAEHGAPSGEQYSAQDLNQSARWIAAKEEAASAIMTIVSEYMLAQRVKKVGFETDEEYHKALEAHHVLLQSAMKAKQSVELEAFLDLEHAITDVAIYYTT